MDPSEQITNQEKKIKNLELELNDLRQGLTTVQDYYCDLERLTKNQEAAESIEQEIVRPQVDDEREFEGIWQFHEEMLIEDLSAGIPSAEMYDAFVQYCKKTSQHIVELSAFEFIFARMENPHPLLKKGIWKGYRLKTD
jgi:DICT domain-containing protein